jgi:hypothetical protein
MTSRFHRHRARLLRGLISLGLLAAIVGFNGVVLVHADAYAGNGLSFNTLDQYARFNNDPSLNAATSIRTLEAWVKFHSFAGQQQVVARACGTSGMEISMNFGELNVYVQGVGSSSPVIYDTVNMQTERWYHLAATHSGPGSVVTLYVDGVPVATGTAAATAIRDSSEDPDSFCQGDPANHELRIGSWGGGGQFLNGIVDEVRVWNTTRTGDEIRRNLYRELTGGETGLVAYYPLNETVGLTVPDRSTTVKSITLTGGGSGYTSIPTIALSGGGGTGAAASVANMRVNGATLNAAGSGYAVNNVLTVTGGTFSSAATITVTAVNGSGGVTAFTLGDRGIYTALPSNPVNVTGGAGTGARFNLYWAVRAVQLTAAGSGYTSAPTVNFSSGAAAATTNVRNHGTLYDLGLTGAATWVTSGAIYGPRHALDFDGTNDYVSGSSPLSVIGPASNVTLMAWIKPDVTGTRNILSLSPLSSNEVVELRLNSVNQLEYGRNPAAWQSVTSTASIPTGVWTHVAAVQTGASVQLYLNGVPDGSGSLGNATNITNLYLGSRRYLGSNDQFFNGQLDEVRLWNTARTAVQVQEDMARSLDGNEAGLIGYYRMDYGTAGGGNAALTTLYDITTGNNDGTLVNFALTGASSNWVESAAFNIWSGTINAVWSNGGNWSRAAAPVSTDNVYIGGYPNGNAPTLASGITVNHLVIGSGGALSISGANALTVNGNLVNNGSLTANNSLITFAGGGTHHLVFNSPLAFNDLTVDSGNTVNEVVAADNATIDGVLTNNGLIRKTQSIAATGAHTFGLTGVAVNVDTLANLSQLTVERTDANHPNAAVAPLLTGRYWRITRALSGGTTEGQLDLTLPYGAAGINTKACRWIDGSSSPGFDCGQASDNTYVPNLSVTRHNYPTADWAAQGANFDLWTVGSSVGPNAVTLNGLRATSADQSAAGWLAPLIVLGLGGAVALVRRRRSA